MADPPSSEPPSDGSGLDLRRRLRRLRYRLEDAGAALTSLAKTGLARARETWSKWPERTRRLVALGAGAVLVIVVIALLLVPALPCGLPGADSCPPEDDAAEVVPSDALLYVHVNTDADTDQYEQAAELAGRLPTLTAQVVAALPGAAGAGIDYERDVRPWLGGEAAAALVAGDGRDVAQALLLEVGDDNGAERFTGELVGRRTQGRDYEGVEVTTKGDLSVAELAGFLVIGSEAAVRSVIDAQADDRSLADDEAAEVVADELPDDSFATAFVSREGAADLFRAGAPLGSLEVFVNSSATAGAGAALVAGDGGFEVETHSVLDPERLKSAPGFFNAFTAFDPDLAGELSGASLLYLGLADPEGSIQALLRQASAESPGLTEGFEEFAADLKKDGDISIEREILPLLGGEVAVGIEPPPKGGQQRGGAEQEGLPEGIEPGGPAPIPEEPGELDFTGVPYLVFVADDVDEEQARKTLADLQVPIAKAFDPEEGRQAPVFEGADIAGVQARSLRISPTVNLTYAIFDEKLVVATDPAGVEQVKEGESSLSDSDQYEAATDGFADELATLIYLNLGDLIALAERQGLAEDPAYALFADEVRKLQALGLEVELSDTALDARLRLTVER